MADVSPDLQERNRDAGATGPDPVRLTAAAADLRQAIDDLTRSITSGGAFGKEDARDRFEFALADFSALIDTTAT